jgi:predicted phosphohydrolase
MNTRKLLIQVLSDIHIELWNKFPKFPAKCKYLILAGDIGQINHQSFYPFLDYCSVNWEKTFYIPGNHEYYSKDKNMTELEFEYKFNIESRYKNIFYLNNSVVELENDINIYGSTFWTKPLCFTTDNDIAYLNDYNFITYFKQGLDKVVKLDVQKVREMSNDSFEQLHEYLAGENKKTIIVTHFPPQQTGTSHLKYRLQGEVMKNYFSHPNGLLSKLDNISNILCWISGHTHYSYDFISPEGIRLISNQLGYRNEAILGDTCFNHDGLYEINVS